MFAAPLWAFVAAMSATKPSRPSDFNTRRAFAKRVAKRRQRKGYA